MDIYICRNEFKYVTLVFAIFMMMNVGISCVAGARQNARVQKIEAHSKLDAFLDKHYSDKVMDRVYSNKITKTKMSKN